MAMTIYPAVTAGQLQALEDRTKPVAWMACLFSPYGTGLSNLPTQLPPDSIVMVNDRTPIWHHRNAHIAQQLQTLIRQLKPRGVVLDFQRLGSPETQDLAGYLTQQLPCPVAVSDGYAAELTGPVFLSVPPLCTPLSAHIAPWASREIWLEAVCTREQLILTPQGCQRLEFPPAEDALPFSHKDLMCAYDFTVSAQQAQFTLERSIQQLSDFLQAAQQLGITTAIGLYQQLKNMPSE